MTLSRFLTARRTGQGMKQTHGFACSLEITAELYRGIPPNLPWLIRKRVFDCFGFKGTRSDAGLKVPAQVGNHQNLISMCTREVVRFHGEEGKGGKGGLGAGVGIGPFPTGEIHRLGRSHS